MRFSDYFRLALGNITRQKLRTALTVFAVVIGATSVTIMLALVTGAKSFVQSQYESSGAMQQVIVTQQTDLDYDAARNGGGRGNSGGIVLNDAIVAKVAAIPHITGVTPIADVHVLEGLEYQGKKLTVERATAYEPNGVLKHTVLAGRDLDMTDGDNTIVISDQYAKKFGFSGTYESIIGKEINLLTNESFTGEGAVIAEPAMPTPGSNQQNQRPPGQVTTLHAKVVGVTSGVDEGPTVSLPLSWAKKLLINQRYEVDQTAMTQAQQAQQQAMQNQNRNLQPGQKPAPPAPLTPKYNLVKEDQLAINGYRSLTAKADSTKTVDEAANAIRGLGVGAATAASYVKQQLTIFNIVGLVLGGIGGIALLVAAIGVINTMFMAILERTREIGVMRACGATRSDVRRLFTFEAALLGFAGGVVGILIGFGLTKIANNLLNGQFTDSGIDSSNIITLPPWLILSVIGTTTVIGIIAGLVPAGRASRLNPVEALRYE